MPQLCFLQVYMHRDDVWCDKVYLYIIEYYGLLTCIFHSMETLLN